MGDVNTGVGVNKSSTLRGLPCVVCPVSDGSRQAIKRHHTLMRSHKNVPSSVDVYSTSPDLSSPNFCTTNHQAQAWPHRQQQREWMHVLTPDTGVNVPRQCVLLCGQAVGGSRASRLVIQGE